MARRRAGGVARSAAAWHPVRLVQGPGPETGWEAKGRGRRIPYLLERHRVSDYGRWREVFDADAAGRSTAGCRGARVFRNADDPEEVVVLFEWDDLDNARQRIASAALGREFEEAGVSGGIGRTEFYLLEEETPPAT